MTLWLWLAGIALAAACAAASGLTIRRYRRLRREAEHQGRVAAREIGELERLGPEIFFDLSNRPSEPNEP